MAELGVKTVVHLVGSVPLSDSETVFKTLSSGVGRFFSRLPDGETGIRKSWIRFLQDVLAQHPAIEVAHDRIAGGVESGPQRLVGAGGG